MNFFESNHCKSEAHCKLCRDRAGGKDFRQSLLDDFNDIKKTEFKCPNGKPFIDKPIEPHILTVAQLVKDLPDTKTGKWSKAMITQCYHIMMHPPKGITCKTKRAFRSRCTRKIEYYSGLCVNE